MNTASETSMYIAMYAVPAILLMPVLILMLLERHNRNKQAKREQETARASLNV
jgi:hypothetical protein